MPRVRLLWTVPSTLLLTTTLGCLEGDRGFPTRFARLGDYCRASDWCLEGLRCQYDRCRAICATASDCGAASVCIAIDCFVPEGQDQCAPWGQGDAPYRVCTLPDERGCIFTAGAGEPDGCEIPLYCGRDRYCREGCGSAGAEFVPCESGYYCDVQDEHGAGTCQEETE